ncbi:MAG: hypothetical protein M1834_000746 [Cirrosporium novae-zelandiae]|nr:MAG: hypothetical protein M1834_000746 [Cirrosporium novae-zelandiae]
MDFLLEVQGFIYIYRRSDHNLPSDSEEGDIVAETGVSNDDVFMTGALQADLPMTPVGGANAPPLGSLLE